MRLFRKRKALISEAQGAYPGSTRHVRQLTTCHEPTNHVKFLHNATQVSLHAKAPSG